MENKSLSVALKHMMFIHKSDRHMEPVMELRLGELLHFCFALQLSSQCLKYDSVEVVD